MRTRLVVLAIVMLGATCAHAPPPSSPAAPEGWAADNWRRITRFLDETARTPRRGRAPFAVFDWDNTMMRNDIGDATVFWMLRNDRVRAPRGGDWRAINDDLSEEAVTALSRACAATVSAGVLATSRNAACADEILKVYEDGVTTSGARAFTTADTSTMKQPYLFGAQLLTGHPPEAVRGFVRAAYEEASLAPIGATWKVGSHDVTGWVRIYPAMVALMDAARKSGVEVFVVSASAQPLVEEVARHAGVDADHVVGIRLQLDGEGALTSHPEPCGGDPAVITFDEGKRCWINKAILGLDEKSQKARAEESLRQVLAAGDADTDVAMLRDATGLKIVVNRQKPRLMCHAFGERDGRWIVQPMFIDPLPRRSEKYACTALKDAWGKPVVDEKDQPIADLEEPALP